ncbi:hypothetical protein WH50_05375 [Pokkaliibacter plantistimulans]|uniref:Uncharacterized protein n=1 Tax=Pokkaliibacter plantistimulans TaxID=1635171 RepID=A0ABX5M0E9_9GAMM|nr:hypothetical protein WH50_05375 [Pokkaliibacter plantistimulans]
MAEDDAPGILLSSWTCADAGSDIGQGSQQGGPDQIMGGRSREAGSVTSKGSRSVARQPDCVAKNFGMFFWAC